jgi:hypothetical protein
MYRGLAAKPTAEGLLRQQSSQRRRLLPASRASSVRWWGWQRIKFRNVFKARIPIRAIRDKDMSIRSYCYGAI